MSADLARLGPELCLLRSLDRDRTLLGSLGQDPGLLRSLESTNPFATRWVQPGALEYVWPDGDGGNALLGRLAAGASVEIVGPHGSGKSTLVAALVALLRACGRACTLETLHDGGGRRSLATWPGTEMRVRIVDGFEQLPGWRRRLVRWRARSAGDALVVTAHAPQGMDHTLRSEVDAALTARLVEALLARAELPTHIDPAGVFARVERLDGNLREALFELYDLYEAERAHLRRAARPADAPGPRQQRALTRPGA